MAIFSFASSYAAIYLIDRFAHFRATDDEQLEGLDYVEYGMESYPEFKQTI